MDVSILLEEAIIHIIRRDLPTKDEGKKKENLNLKN